MVGETVQITEMTDKIKHKPLTLYKRNAGRSAKIEHFCS